MKIKNLAFIALTSMIMCGIGILKYLEVHHRSVNLLRMHQHQIPEPYSDRSASISDRMILVLLAVGVTGALGVRRKKKNKQSPTQHHNFRPSSKDRDKAFIKLNKQYLKLQYQVTQHKYSGDRPPDGLIAKLSDLEREVRLISRALE